MSYSTPEFVANLQGHLDRADTLENCCNDCAEALSRIQGFADGAPAGEMIPIRGVGFSGEPIAYEKIIAEAKDIHCRPGHGSFGNCGVLEDIANQCDYEDSDADAQ